MSRYKAIIFDYDGVISDSLDVKTEAFAEMYRHYGEDIEKKVVDHHKSNGGVSRFEKFRIYHGDYLGEEVNDQKVSELAEHFSALVLEKVVQADYVPGVMEFISSFHSQYDLFISTGTPELEIREILKRKKISRYFREVFGSPEKKTNHVRKIIQKYRYNPSEMIFVGDAPTDRDAARENGLTFIGRFTTAEEIKKEKYLIQDFKNFNSYLNTL
jgi:phosphoglycolate phosphatase-like HAD superfamily hydrolase